MLPVGTSFLSQPNILFLALVFGMIPSGLWLYFWLQEDNKRKEPIGLVAMTFLAGMFAVILVLPIERLIAGAITNDIIRTGLWSAAEELFKLLAFAAIATNSPFLDEPIDYAVYMMAAALGFAGLENALFLMQPLATQDTIVSFLTGNLRFLGATLLHSVTSGLLGASIGLAFFKSPQTRFWYGFIGFCAATALHGVFNFFIIKNNGENFLQVFGFLWVVAIIIMLLFEKLRRMGNYLPEEIEQQTTTL